MITNFVFQSYVIKIILRLNCFSKNILYILNLALFALSLLNIPIAFSLLL